jgi:hypothetical protein
MAQATVLVARVGGRAKRLINRGARRPDPWHRLGPFQVPSKPSSVARVYPAREAHNCNGFAPVSKLWPRCGRVRDRSARVRTDAPDGPPTIDAMPLEIHTQPDPEHFCETCGGPLELVSLTITPWDGNETTAREMSPVCRPVVPEPQTTAFEDERHARLRALSRSLGPAEGVPGHGSVWLLVNCAVRSGAGWPGSAHQPHTAGFLHLHSQTTGSDHHPDRRTQQGSR